MKKFMVVLVLLVGCALLYGQESTDKVLEKVPDEYIGKYYMYAMIADGKQYIKDGRRIGTMVSDAFVVAYDGEISRISKITTSTFQGKLILFIEFVDKEDVFSITKADEELYYMCMYTKGNEKCSHILVIKIKKLEEVQK